MVDRGSPDAILIPCILIPGTGGWFLLVGFVLKEFRELVWHWVLFRWLLEMVSRQDAILNDDWEEGKVLV